jgi:hypothetical protein
MTIRYHAPKDFTAGLVPMPTLELARTWTPSGATINPTTLAGRKSQLRGAQKMRKPKKSRYEVDL